MKKCELGSAIFIFIFSIIVFLESNRLHIGRLSSPGPGFLPLLAGTILFLLSLILIIKTCLQIFKQSYIDRKVWYGLNWEKVIYTLLSLTAYAFLLEKLGYILSTLFLMSFLLRLIEPKKWTVVILYAAIISIVSYTIFKFYLQIQLPKGFLPI